MELNLFSYLFIGSSSLSCFESRKTKKSKKSKKKQRRKKKEFKITVLCLFYVYLYPASRPQLYRHSISSS